MTPEQKKIFDSLSSKEKPEETLSLHSRVLIVDSLNTFMRSFAVIRHVNHNLTPIGGLTGFLRSLGYAINLIRPTRVIAVFDGQGSSTNKRYIYPEYKANRSLRRITNWDHFETQEDESEAIINQVVRLVEYMKCLPIDMITIDKIEADDVIGYVAQRVGKDTTILSSDRDYLQLVNDRVTVFSPTKKKFYTPKLVLEEYGVTPENFLLQKMLLGDSGDNVPGVQGLGPKTLIKEFPELGKTDRVTLNEVLAKCRIGKKRVHGSIRNFERQLEINKLLMDLENPNIPEEGINEIESTILEPYKTFDSQEFIRLYNEDDLGNSIPNVQNWLFNHFHTLSKYKE
jgi:DNA polymerase-1